MSLWGRSFCNKERPSVLFITRGHSSLQKERPYLFPQQTAQHGAEPHNTGLLHPFVIYLYLIHFYFSLIPFICKSIFLYMGKVNFFSHMPWGQAPSSPLGSGTSVTNGVKHLPSPASSPHKKFHGSAPCRHMELSYYSILTSIYSIPSLMMSWSLSTFSITVP